MEPKMTKRTYGDGGIYPQGKNTFRLRYRIDGKRYSKTVEGTRKDAREELRRLLHSGVTKEFVAPDKITLAAWVKHWIDIGCPGRKREKVGQRAIERYAQLLRTHVLPTLGDYKLQQIDSDHIDGLYLGLEGKIAPRTARHVHSVFNACLGAAVRKKKLIVNPMTSAEKIPSAGESDHGVALDDQELQALVRGFEGSALFGIVSVAAFTGARRNEILALRWTDLDPVNKTLRIERALEETDEFGIRFKGPKKKTHKRTITIDDDLLALLLAARDKHLRLVAGIPDGVTVDLGLVKLPDGALMFPNPPEPGSDFSLTTPRRPRAVTKEFARKARQLGFKKLRLHDLRGTHETMLLDAGVPVHTVASRCGHDPATLLRSYAKRSHKGDTSAASIIGNISRTILGK
jgi:integrase